MKKITKEDELEIYKMVLRGNRNQTEIAAEYGINQSRVSQIYNNIIKKKDTELAVAAALEFVATYIRVEDYMSMKLAELEDLKENSDDDKLKEKIIMDQITIQEIILQHISQKKFIQAVQEDANAYAFFLKNQKELDEK